MWEVTLGKRESDFIYHLLVYYLFIIYYLCDFIYYFIIFIFFPTSFGLFYGMTLTLFVQYLDFGDHEYSQYEIIWDHIKLCIISLTVTLHHSSLKCDVMPNVSKPSNILWLRNFGLPCNLKIFTDIIKAANSLQTTLKKYFPL